MHTRSPCMEPQQQMASCVELIGKAGKIWKVGRQQQMAYCSAIRGKAGKEKARRGKGRREGGEEGEGRREGSCLSFPREARRLTACIARAMHRTAHAKHRKAKKQNMISDTHTLRHGCPVRQVYISIICCARIEYREFTTELRWQT